MSYVSPPRLPGIIDKTGQITVDSPVPDFYERVRQESLEDSVDSANTSFSSYSGISEECLTPLIPSEENPHKSHYSHDGSEILLDSRKPLGEICLNAIQIDPSLPISVPPRKLSDPFAWSPNQAIQILQPSPDSSNKNSVPSIDDLLETKVQSRPINRLRSGSESKAQSLQPVEIKCTDGQKILTICPSLFTVKEGLTDKSEVEKTAPNGFEWRQVQELNEENLRRLNELLESEEHGDSLGSSFIKLEQGDAESAKFLDSDDDEDDHVLINGRSRHTESGAPRDCSTNLSIVPTIASPPSFIHSPFVNDSTDIAESVSPKGSKVASDRFLKVDSSSKKVSTFFDHDVVLPLPSNDPTLKSNKTTRDPKVVKSGVNISLERLSTMLLKQRKVDFEYDDTESFLSQDSPPENSAEEVSTDEGNKSKRGKSRRKVGKVRCTLSKDERMLGIRWLHLVDTSTTTNPNITPEVRYHASILFSLYWGSRTGNSSPDQSKSTEDSDVPLKEGRHSQSKKKENVETSREKRKKSKLIAATAMASLTLATKWHFDFCKPLFTVQLKSFCQTTNFGSFKVTPENLIMAERAILFSYPVAGGLWLDCPHAFLEELINVVPTLNILSSIPEYILRKNYYNVGQSLRYYDEQKNVKEIDSDGVWDWPDVMHEFDLALEKVTTVQEFLAFNPAVFCVIALYLALVEVEPGYYEKKQDSRKKKDELLDTSKDITDETIMTSENIQDTLKKLLIEEEHSELWVWKFIDVNDTMNQVCEALRVSARDVEECLNWYSEVGFANIHFP
ncbi:uncharacterized protein MELLADRAFT_95356 [Melampsora larici-populina 98AG31]|uniref:Uncharacterized protein n=1 Tax=Melampsora larici-populina (strain 98AG31 / pathotype 3-4-7) TaxID=747676 RepID=F4RD52_MELLP|nr:uncharacterized protein MELLADRAFT_95356 [Melampsora larici-populina 98AG31]EGG09840.1 hypothetical protein MELLADRAFT_95356 [Melampsora larici-populina 98AG31]